MQIRARLIQLGALIAFFSIWEAVTRAGWLNQKLLPSASTVFTTLWTLRSSPDFLSNALVTANEVVLAFVIGAPLAIVIGCIVGERIVLRRNIGPMIFFLLAVPQSIFLPVFIQAFGVGLVEKVIFGVTHLFFVLAVTTIGAVQSVPRGQILAVRSFGARRIQIYTRLYLPSMLPVLVNGLRVAMIFDVLGILVAEMYASQAGVGLMLMQWGENYQVPKLMAVILLISIVTVFFNEALRYCEARLDPRHSSETS